MAEPSPPPAVEEGIAALEQRLGGEDLLRRVQTRQGELASFDFRLPQDFLGKDRVAHIGFLRTFPRSGLHVNITPSAFLEWPHVMSKGVCLFENRKRPLGGSPDTAVRATVDQLDALVRLVVPTADPHKRLAEFRREIRSYWNQQLHESGSRVVLADAPDTARPLFVLTDAQLRKNQNTVVLASTVDALAATFERLGASGAVRPKAPAEAGFYLPLSALPDAPRLPPPDALPAWLAGCASADDVERFRRWLGTGAYPFRFVVLRLPDNGGTPAFYPLVVRSRGLANSAKPKYGGRAARRMANVPAASTPAALSGAVLHVIAREVVHSRAIDVADQLKGAHVVLVGGGSLGGALAVDLARAGVGRLTIVDPEALEAENLGRHTLGAEYLGESKAAALKERLQRDVPTVAVTAVVDCAQFDKPEVVEALASASLVLISTADWRSELWLWERKQTGASWALVQVWSEPNALVGHALVSPTNSQDNAQPLFTDVGDFRHKFTEWKNDGVVHQPGCGDSFIPGGPIALAAIAAMGAQAAVDVLVGRRTTAAWYALVSRAGLIEAAGGMYHGPELPADVDTQVMVRAWPSSENPAP